MDYDFWLGIALKSKIKYIPKLLANFRIYAATKSQVVCPIWTRSGKSTVTFAGIRLLNTEYATKGIRSEQFGPHLYHRKYHLNGIFVVKDHTLLIAMGFKMIH